MATTQRPRVVICAEITADGKLAETKLAVPPLLYDGGTDPARHPWAKVYDAAGGILVDGDAENALSMPQAVKPAAIRLYPSRAESAAERQREISSVLGKMRAGGSRGGVLCFGGAELLRALLEGGLADELRLIVQPRFDGRRDAPSLSGPGVADFFPASVACRLLKMETHGGECLLHYRVVRRGAKRRA